MYKLKFIYISIDEKEKGAKKITEKLISVMKINIIVSNYSITSDFLESQLIFL
jgi:hypothetical protein